MFWSGNYIAVRELNSLLKEENVTLSQVLEADDILQECKADNKALMLFLTRPEILNELITLITEEPPKNVELSQQYRHANIACEVLTSHLSMLSDRLSSDKVQMNRLCDFVNRDPPLNPLLASYFSKTVEMLLEKSPKQDCYLYHIVCLRVLDFFKSRCDFLPNLLRHLSTSAIADVFKYFIRLDDLFNKTVMEWFDEHQVLEGLIQTMCGNYSAGEGPDTVTAGPDTVAAGPDTVAAGPDRPGSEKEDLNHNQGERGLNHAGSGAVGAARRRARVAADNACALLAEVVAGGGAEGAGAGRTAAALGARLGSAEGVARLLGAAFTAEGAGRAAAAGHAAALLRQLLQASSPAAPSPSTELHLAVAPHIPLLHHALLHPPLQESIYPNNRPCVGFARLQIATLIAELTLSPVHEVCTTLLALGTPGVLVQLVEQFPDNNFLHAAVLSMVRNALCNNHLYSTHYAQHLFGECDMLNRFMDLYEENENKDGGCRRGHAGHVALALLAAEHAAPLAPPAAARRYAAFLDSTLRPLQHMLDTPLGGTHPADSIYEVGCIMDTLAANFDFSDMSAANNMEEGGDDLTNENECGVSDSHADSPEFVADGLGLHDDIDEHNQMNKAKSNFLELANQRFDDDMWDDAPEGEGEGEGEDAAGLQHGLDHFSPWAGGAAAGAAGAGGGGGEGWAHFEAAPVAPAPAPAPASTPTAPPDDSPFDDFSPFWSYEDTQQQEEAEQEEEEEEGVCGALSSLRLAEGAALASNLLTAMSGMSPAALASLVHLHRPHTHTQRDVTAVPHLHHTAALGEPRAHGKTNHNDDYFEADNTNEAIDNIPPTVVENRAELDTNPAGDDNIALDKTAAVDGTPDVEGSSGSPENKKSSDPWRSNDDKTEPDLSTSNFLQSSDDTDDKKSNTDAPQSTDHTATNDIPSAVDTLKSCDDSDDGQKSESDKASSPPTDDKGKSDIKPSAAENACDNPEDSER